MTASGKYWHVGNVGFLIAAILFATPAGAQQLPAIADIPSDMAVSRPYLAHDRETLQKKRDALHNGYIAYNAECSAVKSNDTVKISHCTEKRQTLLTDLAQHIERTNAFNRDVGVKTVVIPKDCPPGSSLAGAVCVKDASMPSTAEQLTELRQQAQDISREIRRHGFSISVDGALMALGGMVGAKGDDPSTPDTEQEANEMRDLAKRYLEIEKRIGELNGGPSLVPDPRAPVEATEPIRAKPYTPGDVDIPPGLTDKRPIPPNGHKPGQDLTSPTH